MGGLQISIAIAIVPSWSRVSPSSRCHFCPLAFSPGNDFLLLIRVAAGYLEGLPLDPATGLVLTPLAFLDFPS